MSSVVIIGGGLGGLFTGAILAKEGFHVRVLEKNSTIGGGLQTFRRMGQTFDTGMHVIGGMQEGGNIRRICRYLGIDNKVRLREVGTNCSERIYFAEDHATFELRNTRSAFTDTLTTYFPHEADNIRAYVTALYDMVDGIHLFNLRPQPAAISVPKPEFTQPADEFVARYVGDHRLRGLLAYMNPLYGGRRGHTPAYVHALISVLYINGTQRFVGGSSHFAQILSDLITQAGGEVLPGDGVTHIEVADRSVVYVETRSGRRYTADHYISAIHPCSLIALSSPGAFTKAYRERMEAIPNSYSAFSVFLKFKPDSFPYMDCTEYYMTRYDDIWEFGNPDKTWPLGFLLMTPPEDEQGPFSRKALLTAPMLFDAARRWEHTTVGRRGADYEAWKQRCADRLMGMLEELHPDFSQCVEGINTASPLTIRDFYGVKGGALTGFSKDCQNIALTQVPVYTKVRNLLLTGQNVNLHGFCGVPLTAINTAEALLGLNYVIRKINAL